MNKSNGQIKVTRTPHISKSAGEKNVQVSGLGYVSSPQNILMMTVKIGGDAVVYRSEDNTNTWREVERHPIDTQVADDLLLEHYGPNFFVDPKTGRLYGGILHVCTSQA
jgi:hypothetical protein